jgi:hypothetical protein
LVLCMFPPLIHLTSSCVGRLRDGYFANTRCATSNLVQLDVGQFQSLLIIGPGLASFVGAACGGFFFIDASPAAGRYCSHISKPSKMAVTWNTTKLAVIISKGPSLTWPSSFVSLIVIFGPCLSARPNV